MWLLDSEWCSRYVVYIRLSTFLSCHAAGAYLGGIASGLSTYLFVWLLSRCQLLDAKLAGDMNQQR